MRVFTFIIAISIAPILKSFPASQIYGGWMHLAENGLYIRIFLDDETFYYATIQASGAVQFVGYGKYTISENLVTYKFEHSESVDESKRIPVGYKRQEAFREVGETSFQTTTKKGSSIEFKKVASDPLVKSGVEKSGLRFSPFWMLEKPSYKATNELRIPRNLYHADVPGIAAVRVDVSESGKVVQFKCIFATDIGYYDETLAKAGSWRYTPGRFENKEVPTTFYILYLFNTI